MKIKATGNSAAATISVIGLILLYEWLIYINSVYQKGWATGVGTRGLGDWGDKGTRETRRTRGGHFCAGVEELRTCPWTRGASALRGFPALKHLAWTRKNLSDSQCPMTAGASSRETRPTHCLPNALCPMPT
ncbi:hypothetical protein PI95_000070 [Hassallia byssoidea VB512170]|uniref:Uncharacterized protein n=1 Tax=Hassallia byssoidea VB512170 TaxID=1304833 RepID=A0A846H343_9CYAN|nr:hypothetical protein [Hassalia byssoidea]NEU71011.1 hypothetical protein [Hassalia byssoidea VB512170]